MVSAMDSDLVRSAAFGVLGALLIFELVAAARSWYEARAKRPGHGLAPHGIAQPDHGTLLLSQAFAIRDHLARRRLVVSGLRQQYPALRTDAYGRHLRSSVARLRRQAIGSVAAACPSCRGSRLRGEAYCQDCRRRLVVPTMSTSA